MIIQTVKVETPLFNYNQCEIGQVYSYTKTIGTRDETNYYLRTQAGMANLDNGMFISAGSFTLATGLHLSYRFKHEPDAKLVV